MTLTFRALLLFASVWAVYIVIKNIRKSKMLISDSLFWFFFSVLLLILAIFPQISYVFSHLLGVQSPANLVFLVVFAVLIYCLFKQTLRISLLEKKVQELTQHIAIREKDSDTDGQQN